MTDIQPTESVAFGKINLHLAVGDRREDGYHELTTIFQSLSLADTVRLIPTGFTRGPIVSGLEVRQRTPGVPTDQSNLAWQAAEEVANAFRSAGDALLPQVRIVIDKSIPVAGGMAGGSADAAAALKATQEMLSGVLGFSLSEDTVSTIAAKLGSDVPFCLIGGTCLGTGRGEKLVTIPTRGTYHWALAFSDTGLSTPKVFQHLDYQREEMAAGRRPERRLGTPEDLQRALLTGDPSQVGQFLGNDLQSAAISLQPKLPRVLAVGQEAGALGGIVSGSGPTCGFLCRDSEHAQEVVVALTSAGVCQSACTASTLDKEHHDTTD